MLSCSLICAGQETQIRPEWAVFSSPLKWESPPPELQSKEKTAPARIRVFFPSGDYGQVGCYLIRQEDGSVSISRGDGFVVAIGKWKQDRAKVLVSSRVVYRTVVIMNRPIPEPESTEQFIAEKGTYTTTQGEKQRRYAPMPKFKDWGFLADLIRCDREYFDGKKHVDGVQPCRPKPN
jgi:hypothetical protein